MFKEVLGYADKSRELIVIPTDSSKIIRKVLVNIGLSYADNIFSDILKETSALLD